MMELLSAVLENTSDIALYICLLEVMDDDSGRS